MKFRKVLKPAFQSLEEYQCPAPTLFCYEPLLTNCHVDRGAAYSCKTAASPTLKANFSVI